jgi:hypothetical protein
MNKSHNGPDNPLESPFCNNGFCMNSEKDPAKRARNLSKRILLLETEKKKLDDQIEIMNHELRAIDQRSFIESLEQKRDAMDLI